MSTSTPHDLSPLRAFVNQMALLVDRAHNERDILEGGYPLLAELVARDGWLPDAWAEPHPERYQQYLLHCDGRERFSVVSFVWGPGQRTPIHDHRVWGLVGILRGAERVENFSRRQGVLVRNGQDEILSAGEVVPLSPRLGDIHRVANALPDQVSVSIHVYGANIGAIERSVFDEAGARRPFISGYSERALPNIWQPT